MKTRRMGGMGMWLYEGEEKYIQGFGRKPGGMLPLGRLKHRWGNDISVAM
jgi:hypothetical protein